MNLDTFFEHFEKFADAPNAIEITRRLIIRLAVSGKLCVNRPDDKPVSLKLSGNGRANGNLPRNWQAGFLGEAIELQYGKNLPKKARSDSGAVAVFGSNGIVGRHHECLMRDPAIIIGRKGSAGALNVSTGPSWTTDVAYYVVPPKDLDVRFTYFLLSSLKLEELAKGIKPGLSRKEAYQLSVYIPPLAEQKRIVAKVDELMALCDRLDEQQRERDAQHKRIVHAATTRFNQSPTPKTLNLLFHKNYQIPPAELRKTILNLAVRGKLVNREQIGAGSQIDSSVPFFDADILVPDGWVLAPLKLVADFINGDRSKNYPSKSLRVESGVPFINAGHLVKGDVSLESMDYITEAHYEKLGSGKVQRGDVLYCLRGSLGKTAVVHSINRGAIASSLLIIRPSGRLLAEYLYYYLLSPLGDQMIRKYDNGSAQPNLSATNVKKYLLPLPPLEEQKRIVAQVDRLMALVDRLEADLAKSRAVSEELMEAVLADVTAEGHA